MVVGRLRCVFGHRPQVLKQQAAKEQGRVPEKRVRYTENDRPTMEHCWRIASAYRESLLSRASGSEGGSLEPRPSVPDMLQGAVAV